MLFLLDPIEESDKSKCFFSLREQQNQKRSENWPVETSCKKNEKKINCLNNSLDINVPFYI